MNPVFVTYAALAVACEVTGTTLLKLSDRFTGPLPTAAVASFFFLSVALAHLPIGVASAVRSGLGIVLISAIGFVVFRQTLDFAAVIGLGSIVVGVITLNVFSTTLSHRPRRGGKVARSGRGWCRPRGLVAASGDPSLGTRSPGADGGGRWCATVQPGRFDVSILPPVSRRPTARARRSLACAAALLLGCASGAAAATVEVVVSGVEPGGGRVLVSLCEGGLEPRDCPVGQAVAATRETVAFTFPDVPPGTYAVAAFQDANGNGVLDRTRNGLPTEPYGFSNGTGRPSVPRFERAAFGVRGDATVAIRLTSILTRR